MAAAFFFGSLAAFAAGGVRSSVGFMAGSAMSLVNYLWLESSLRAMFAGSMSTSTIFVAARYVLRYFLIGGLLLAIYLTEALPMPAVISGLAIFAAAALLQGFSDVISNNR